MADSKPPTKRPARKAVKPPPADVPRETSDGGESNVVPLRGGGRGVNGNRVRGSGRKPDKLIAVAERRARVLALAAAGANFVQIASQIRSEYKDVGNYDNKSASGDVAIALGEIRRDSVAQYVDLMEVKLDRALMALNSKIAAGNEGAIHAMLAIEKRRSALLGADKSRRVELTGANGQPITIQAVPIGSPAEALEQGLKALDGLLD